MNIGKKHTGLFQRMILEIDHNLDEVNLHWSIYDKQLFFVTAISIYDKYFLESKSEEPHHSAFFYRIIEYGYPVFIRKFYHLEFCQLPGVVHKAVESHMMELYDKLLYSCGILGWMQSFVDNINAGYYSCFNIGRFIRVRFKDRFHWNEYIEEQYCSWYSSMVAALKKDEYEELDKKLPGVLEKLKQSVFVWDKAFLGYTTDYEIEDFFQKHALLDTQQSTEWELFPENSKFGSISYGDIVEAIVELSGYAIKHVYCACVLKNKQIDLKIENLLHIILMGSDLVRLIGENRGISEKDAKDILQLISLGPETKDYYKNGNARCAPLIKVSKTQYIRSIRGVLEEPFGFMLYNLRNQYSKEWDKNANQRERYFRNQLYGLFTSTRFRCVSHPVRIERNGRVITDIDAVIIDKENGEIGLFQLKWQDPSGFSPFSLRSKRANYNKETEQWLSAIQQWIADSSDKDIAARIGVPARYIRKQNIHLFVLGRKHGNYSGDTIPEQKCCWSQWYQMLLIAGKLNNQDELTLSKLYDLINRSSPFIQKVIEPMNVFSYGKYKIIFGGNMSGIFAETLSKVHLRFFNTK